MYPQQLLTAHINSQNVPPQTGSQNSGANPEQPGSQGSGSNPQQPGSGSGTPGSQQPSSPNATAPCPVSQLEGNQLALICPTGFRRHPKYCNLFYQCTTGESNFDVKVLVLSCPEGTVYDDDKVQCLPPNEALKCEGEIAQNNLYRLLTNNSLPPVSLNSFLLRQIFNFILIPYRLKLAELHCVPVKDSFLQPQKVARLN